jgi:hypothetical protein
MYSWQTMVQQPRNFFSWGTLAYQCLPANWKGICTLAFLTPQINIVPNNQSLPIPLMAHVWSKRAIQFIPLLIRLGITAGIWTGIGGIALSAFYYNQLSMDLTNDIEQVSRSIVTTQAGLTGLPSISGPPKSERVRLTHCREGRALSFSKWRMLFLCKSVRNSQRHGSAIAGPSHM